MPKSMTCARCGGENVRRDADVMWCQETQQWDTAGVYDSASCDDCGGDTNIIEQELTSDA